MLGISMRLSRSLLSHTHAVPPGSNGVCYGGLSTHNTLDLACEDTIQCQEAHIQLRCSHVCNIRILHMDVLPN